MKHYEIDKDVNDCLKSEWKKEVKDKIGKKTEITIRDKCGRKTRTIQNDQYKLKDYFKLTNLTESKDILRSRLHMTKLTCNYGHTENPRCPLCGCDGKMETEHYFTQCLRTRNLANIAKTTANDLSGTLNEMLRAKNHLKRVEVQMEYHMTKMQKGKEG